MTKLDAGRTTDDFGTREFDGDRAGAKRPAGEEAGFCAPTVHVYTGGGRDFAVSRRCDPFLKKLLGAGATLLVLEDQDHFYVSRKPAVLAWMVSELVTYST